MSEKEFEKKLAAFEKAESAYNVSKKDLESTLKERTGTMVKVNGIPHRVSKRDITKKNEAGEKVKIGESYFLRSLVSQEVLDAMK